jgi:hypothetical protein
MEQNATRQSKAAKHVIASAACVGEVLLTIECCLVIKQTISTYGASLMVALIGRMLKEPYWSER